MRTAEILRKTAETDIILTLNLDGSGKSSIDTGCGFLNHMLTLFARHGRFDLTVKCIGDTKITQVTHSVYVKNYTESRTFIDRNRNSMNESDDSEEKLSEEVLR